ncbi:hypothetical protein OAH97_00260 [Octadecabacter sp.]|nr:hypothetical protein [Octadecabacter sp.]
MSRSSLSAMALANLPLGEVALAAVYRLQPRAVDGNLRATKQIEAATQNDKLTKNLPKGRFVVAREVSDGLKIRLQLLHQPDHVQIAVRLRLQTPTGTHPVQIAVDVEFLQIARIIPRPASRLGQGSSKARSRKIEAVDEGINGTEPHYLEQHNRPRMQAKEAAVSAGFLDVCHAQGYHF